MAGRRLILDSGALSALAAGDERVIAWVYRATEAQMLLGIPAPVLAETFTGRPTDARLHRAIPSRSAILDTTAEIGRVAGRIRFRAEEPNKTVDAIVVATAARFRSSIILTSDPDDLTLLASYCPDAALTVRSVNSMPMKKKARKRSR